METVLPSNQPSSVKFLKLSSPDDLRLIADRLEAHLRNATMPGETVLFPLTKGLTLVLDPTFTVKPGLVVGSEKYQELQMEYEVQALAKQTQKAKT